MTLPVRRALTDDPVPMAGRPSGADIERQFAIAWAALAAVRAPLPGISRVTVLQPVGTWKAE